MSGRAYARLHERGELQRRADSAARLLTDCTVCPRRCRVDRLHGDLGECGIGAAAVVASAGPHHGEEAVLSGWGGSGTIFFSGCSLHCVFCQNDDISHASSASGREDDISHASSDSGRSDDVVHGAGSRSQRPAGEAVGPDELAALMIGLQDAGCHNINLVTPSHVVPQILAALPTAVEAGLHLPLVYNTSGYDAVETLALLDGVVDVYMPDFKVWDPDLAERILTARDYPAVARAAITEMHRQVGDLATDRHGVALRGLLVRHLVMPDATGETVAILHWLADLGPDTAVNVMGQYRPAGRVLREHGRWPALERALTREEHRSALRTAAAAGLIRLLEG